MWLLIVANIDKTINKDIKDIKHLMLKQFDIINFFQYNSSLDWNSLLTHQQFSKKPEGMSHGQPQ